MRKYLASAVLCLFALFAGGLPLVLTPVAIVQAQNLGTLPFSGGSPGGGVVIGTVSGLNSPRIPYASASSTLTDSNLTRLASDTTAIIGQTPTTAQVFQVYNTSDSATSPVNYERGIFDWATTSNFLTIGAVRGGTGTVRQVNYEGAAHNFNISGSASGAQIAAGAYAFTAAGAASLGQANKGAARIYVDYTNTGTVGAVAINKAAGRVNIAAAGTSVVVTNSVVTAASHVFCNVANVDTTAKTCQVTPGAGTMTITLGSSATAQVSIDFFVVSAD